MPRRAPAADRGDLGGLHSLLWAVNWLYCKCVHRIRLFNTAPLPARGAAILIANHTCGVDNFLLQAGTNRVLGFVIAEQFYNLWPLSILTHFLGCIPVKRDGRDLAATRECLRALEEGKIVPIFPEGRITPDSGRTFGEGKSGAAFLTLHAKVPVIPAYIRGTPPTNNVFLAARSPSNARVIFGQPLDLAPFLAPQPSREAEKANMAALTEFLMDSIKALRPISLACEDES